MFRYALLKLTRVVNSWSNTVTEADHFLFLSDWIVMVHRMISRLRDNWAIAAYFLLWPILSVLTFRNSYSCHIFSNFLRDRSTINFIRQDRNYRNLSNNVVKVRSHRTSKRHTASASSVWLFRDSSRENDRATTGHGVIYLTTLYTSIMYITSEYWNSFKFGPVLNSVFQSCDSRLSRTDSGKFNFVLPTFCLTTLAKFSTS